MLNEFVKRSSLERTRQMPATEKMKRINLISDDKAFELFALFEHGANLRDSDLFHGESIAEYYFGRKLLFQTTFSTVQSAKQEKKSFFVYAPCSVMVYASRFSPCQ